jgi:transcription termination factor NusB
METKQKLDSLIARHLAFWEMADVDRPLMRVGTYKPLQPQQPFPLAA